MDIRFSRHAKNKLRLYRLAEADVKTAIEAGESVNIADKWESQYGKLRVIWVTVGSYALVITMVRTR
jgi:hypothetical protein